MLRKERYNNILCKDLLKVTQFASEQMRHLVFTNQNIWAQTSRTKEKYAEEKLVGRREAIGITINTNASFQTNGEHSV